MEFSKTWSVRLFVVYQHFESDKYLITIKTVHSRLYLIVKKGRVDKGNDLPKCL